MTQQSLAPISFPPVNRVKKHPRTVHRVSDQDSLWLALRDAHPRDILQLETGHYGDFYCPAIPYGPPGVVLIPAPGARPVFRTFQATSDITAIGMTAELEPGTQYGVQIWSCRNVVIRGWTIHQKDKKTLAGTGISVRYAQNVFCLANDLSWLGAAASNANSSFVVFARNKYSDINTDGIITAGGSHIAVMDNEARHFIINEASGHPDAIQWWASEGEEVFDLSILGNYIEVGTGGQMQGIFGEVGGVITIEDNSQMGTPTNGLSFSGSDYVEVTNNFIQGYEGDELTPALIVRGDCNTVALVENTCNFVQIGVPSDGADWQPKNVAEEGTEIIPLASGPGDYTEYAKWADSPEAPPVPSPPDPGPPAGGTFIISGTVTLEPVAEAPSREKAPKRIS